MSNPRFTVVAIVLFGLATRALADPDLDRIPQNLPPQTSSDITDISNVLYAQSDLSVTEVRGGLAVPLPPPAPPRWEARLFLDARLHWRLTDNISLVYSGRLNLRAEDGIGFPDHENIRYDLREAYLAWRSGNGTFLDIGRINLKSGVAMGFNPTDFFKTRAVVEADSADPSVLREDRLGTLMLRAQQVWDGGAVTFALAPKLAPTSAPYLNWSLPSFNPMFDRTNAHTRALLKTSFHLYDDVSPELLVYMEDGRTKYGLNVTKGLGQSVVAYAEWSGGDRASLVDDAIVDGQATADLPSMPVIAASAARPFQNDFAFGASYATRADVTFNLEYEFHQAGFSNADWRNWFAARGFRIVVHPGLCRRRGGAGRPQQRIPARRLAGRIHSRPRCSGIYR
jgi:hypothetical protein